jgi:DNA helicase-2/ATP-dependent DNA helicase PcrA
VIGGLRFYERKEVKDVLAYIRVTVNPADDISLARIINYPPRGISDELVKQMRDDANRNQTTLFQIVRTYAVDPLQPARRRKSLTEFIEMIDGFAQLAGEVEFPLLATEILVHTGLKERVKDEEKEDPTRADSKVANLDMLLTEIHAYWAESEAAADQEATPQSRISAYLEEISLITDADKNDDTDEFVSLMTLHSAKGLEFPVVLIGGVEEGLIPYIPMDGKDADTEEERRLFYVGITRAMERLVLGSAGVRMKFGTLHYQAKSSFLREIPENLMNIQDYSMTRIQANAFRSPPASQTQWRQGTQPVYYRRTKPADSVQVEPSLSRKVLPFAPTPSSSATPPAGNLLRGDDLRRGMLVKHHKYNLGVIVKFHPVPPDWEVVVDFDEFGTKTLRLNYAKLEAAKG